MRWTKLRGKVVSREYPHKVCAMHDRARRIARRGVERGWQCSQGRAVAGGDHCTCEPLIVTGV